jgi:hypothetical protein
MLGAVKQVGSSSPCWAAESDLSRCALSCRGERERDGTPAGEREREREGERGRANVSGSDTPPAASLAHTLWSIPRARGLVLSHIRRNDPRTLTLGARIHEPMGRESTSRSAFGGQRIASPRRHTRERGRGKGRVTVAARVGGIDGIRARRRGNPPDIRKQRLELPIHLKCNR